MGSGSWSAKNYASYSYVTKCGATVDTSTGYLNTSMSNQEMYKKRSLSNKLDPKNVIRECVDSEEHPCTVPVILALDVTGSMGNAAVEVSKRLNAIMTKLYKEVKDVEFMIMGIGDLYYDNVPIQASQFESDIRIAEQLDEVYFEFGGGGNNYESYTAAWYFGLHHCKLDCWKRGKKGIIITMGDEMLNPYLPEQNLRISLGDELQADVVTNDLYKEVCEKYDVYHIDVNHRERWNEKILFESWEDVLDQGHFIKSNLNRIDDDIVNIISNSINNNMDPVNIVDKSSNDDTVGSFARLNENGEIVW